MAVECSEIEETLDKKETLASFLVLAMLLTPTHEMPKTKHHQWIEFGSIFLENVMK